MLSFFSLFSLADAFYSQSNWRKCRCVFPVLSVNSAGKRKELFENWTSVRVKLLVGFLRDGRHIRPGRHLVKNTGLVARESPVDIPSSRNSGRAAFRASVHCKSVVSLCHCCGAASFTPCLVFVFVSQFDVQLKANDVTALR